MARYRKIDLKIWNDEKFYSLSNDGKMLWFYLLTCPQSTMIGAIATKKETVCADLKWSSIRYAIPYQELYSNGMLYFDDRGLYWLKNFLKYNKPENPKVVVSWAKTLDLLPECHLLNFIKKSCVDLCESMGESYLNALSSDFKNYDHDSVGKGIGYGIGYGMPNQITYNIEHKYIKKESIKEKKVSEDSLKPEGVKDETWQDFRKLRSAKKAPITKTVMKNFLLQIEKAGVDVESALSWWCLKGYQGFNADWYLKDISKPISNKNGRSEKPMSEKDYDFSKLYED